MANTEDIKEEIRSSDEKVSDAKKEYLMILMGQYSETWATIRNHSNSVWQVPTLLVTTISILGVAYAQLLASKAARVALLLVAFGFTLVSLIALVKHRFFATCSTRDFEAIERQIKKLLEAQEFKPLLTKHKIEFRDIKFKSEDLAKNRCCVYRISAYSFQLGLTVAILIGVVILLLGEFILFLAPYM